MKNAVLCFGVIVLITNALCIPLKCHEGNTDLKNSCTINEYTSKYNAADEFALDSIYNTANITNLKFTNSKVIYIPNGIFTNLEYLQKLDLSYSHVINMSKKTFAFAFELRELILAHNSITELKDSVFDSADYLEIINLSHNTIQSIDFTVFKNAYCLKKLDLSHNQIKIDSSNIFPAQLPFLNLDYNQITNFTIIDLTNIEQITLNHNELVFLKINSQTKWLEADNNYLVAENLWFNNSHLNSLSLKYNLLANFSFINNLPNLYYLDLSYNRQSGDSTNFKTLTNLKSLILKSSNLSPTDIELFSDLRTLETLDISSNNLNYIDFDQLSRLENLKTLKLNNNNLHTLTFNEFEYLFPELKTIDISENNWICAELITVLIKLKRLKINIDIDAANLSSAADGANIRGIQCVNTTQSMLKYEFDLDATRDNTEFNQILNRFQYDNVMLKTKLKDILHKLNVTNNVRDNVINVNVTKQNDADDGLIENKLSNVEFVIQSKIETNFAELYHIKVYLMAAIQMVLIIMFIGLLFVFCKRRKSKSQEPSNNCNCPAIDCSPQTKGQLLRQV